MKINIEKYNKIMDELQALWYSKENTFVETHNNPEGIRSSQIAALVALLINKGVFEEKEKEDD